MDLDTLLMECEEKMDKAVEHLQAEMRGIRTGRASPALVEFVKVSYYGSPTDLRQLAQVSVPEPTQLLIKPYDASAIAEIVKAIQASGLGLNPMTEGKQVRIVIPALSRERRQQLVGSVHKMAEGAKVAIRNVRRDTNKHIEGLEKDKKAKVTEDLSKSAQEDVQKLTKTHEDKVDVLIKAKEAEVMET